MVAELRAARPPKEGTGDNFCSTVDRESAGDEAASKDAVFFSLPQRAGKQPAGVAACDRETHQPTIERRPAEEHANI
jgi:hypothetical protein